MPLMPGVGRTACMDIIFVLLWGSDTKVVNGWKQRFNCNIMSEYLSTTSFLFSTGVFVCCDEIQG